MGVSLSNWLGYDDADIEAVELGVDVVEVVVAVVAAAVVVDDGVVVVGGTKSSGDAKFDFVADADVVGGDLEDVAEFVADDGYVVGRDAEHVGLRVGGLDENVVLDVVVDVELEDRAFVAAAESAKKVEFGYRS